MLETKTVECVCQECGNTYLRNHVVGSRDLVGSSYCAECFTKIMTKIKYA